MTVSPPDGARSAWSAFWYRPASARQLAGARVLLASTALWVVLSRADLPSVLSFPPELWGQVSFERRLRFLMLFPIGVERALWAALHVSLAAALLGVRPRAACLASGLLLYHFAPFETIIRTANPYLRGLTIPTLGLLALSFSRCGDALALTSSPRAASMPAKSWEYAWPLRLVQVFFCQIYLFAGYSKLFASGGAWLAGTNLRGHLLVLNQALSERPEATWGYALARHEGLCTAAAWAGLGIELAFPLVLISRPARLVLLPAALAFHVANSLLFRIFFQNVPLLLLFVDWTRLLPRRREAA
jgi:hypothetical protein